jgi:hypothetical protein
MSEGDKTGTALPGWLSDALDRISPAPVAPHIADLVVRRPEVGQVGVAEPMDGQGVARFVLVIALDEEDPAATVALLTNELDMATDADVVVPSEATGCPFSLLAETDVVGPVWWAQLRQPVGHVSPEMMEILTDEAAVGPESSAYAAKGLPVLGPSDPRWDFKQSEASDLNALSADRGRDLLAEVSESSAPDLDPALLERAVTSPSPERLLLSLMGHDGRPLFRDLPPAVVACVQRDIGTLEPRALGFDAQQLVEAMLAQALVGSIRMDPEDLKVTWSSTRTDEVRSGALQCLVADRVGRGERSIRLLTTHDAWSDPDEPSVVGRVSEGLVQLVREYADG